MEKKARRCVRETFIKQAQDKRKSEDRERADGSWKKTADTNARQAQGAFRPKLETAGPLSCHAGDGHQLTGHGDPLLGPSMSSSKDTQQSITAEVRYGAVRAGLAFNG